MLQLSIAHLHIKVHGWEAEKYLHERLVRKKISKRSSSGSAGARAKAGAGAGGNMVGRGGEGLVGEKFDRHTQYFQSMLANLSKSCTACSVVELT
jgi:hypothetical protein